MAFSVPNISLGQSLAQLGLADAGRAEEDEGADRALGILQPHAATADGAEQRPRRPRPAPRYARGESAPCAADGRFSSSVSGSGGNAGPSGDDGRNFIGRDLGRAVIALLLPIVFELFQLVTLILFLIAQLGSPLKVL